MKTDVTTYGSLLQSNAKKAAASGATSKLPTKAGAAMDLKTAAKASPDYKVELSKDAKAMAAASDTASSVSAPSLPSAPSTPSLPKIEAPTAEAKPKIELPKEVTEAKDAKDVKDAVEARKVDDKKKIGTDKRPAIIFIKGLDMFSSPSKSERGYAGVGRLADAIPGSRVYGWNQKDEIIEHIMKTDKEWPVLIVGHSLGGDTAHEVAEELDSLENNFRPVDLLITIDSVGFDNDIIPQNVKNHMNVFGENDFFFNDDPHVARRHEMTKVTNILSNLDHTDLDDDKKIQYDIVNLINDTLARKV